MGFRFIDEETIKSVFLSKNLFQRDWNTWFQVSFLKAWFLKLDILGIRKSYRHLLFQAIWSYSSYQLWYVYYLLYQWPYRRDKGVFCFGKHTFSNSFVFFFFYKMQVWESPLTVIHIVNIFVLSSNIIALRGSDAYKFEKYVSCVYVLFLLYYHFSMLLVFQQW
jgi:hypothetical protein